MTNTTIWQAADSMIRVHGASAAMEAAMMADKMLARGDTEGHAMWKSLIQAIRDLEDGKAQRQ